MKNNHVLDNLNISNTGSYIKMHDSKFGTKCLRYELHSARTCLSIVKSAIEPHHNAIISATIEESKVLTGTDVSSKASELSASPALRRDQ